MSNQWSRRDILKIGTGAAAAGVLGALSGCAVSTAPAASVSDAGVLNAGPRRRVLRMAHLTDTHLQPELDAVNGVAQCLRHVQGLKDKPQIIVTGGDLIMDSYDQGRTRTQELWNLWNGVMKDEVSVPVVHTLGNHDIWGWNKARSKTRGDEPGWGKKWACDVIGRDKPYAATDFAGVRIITLDSVHHDHRDPSGYIGQLDDEQFAWLEATLRETPTATPVVIVSHIPIITATCFLLGKPETRTKDHTVPIGEMHADFRRLTDLFRKHSNVRTCLSGHIHLLDRVELNGVVYLCDGAVCGGWWKGKRDWCPEGYAVVDLYSDGTVEREYITYGWQARA